jgi:hypothetical protein
MAGALAAKAYSRPAGAVLAIIRSFLLQKGVVEAPSEERDLFPPDWKVGVTRIPWEVGLAPGGQLSSVLPDISAYDEDGHEIHWTGTVDYAKVARLRASHDTPVRIVAAILASVTGRRIVESDVLGLAQKSPQALEKLKSAGSEYKAHLNRLLDVVALRRSPAFNEVSGRYKAQLRVLIEDQQARIREARIATRRVNQLLGERDEELARLDSGYQPKRATAQLALAAYGISLEENQEALRDEGIVSGVDLDDLNF